MKRLAWSAAAASVLQACTPSLSPELGAACTSSRGSRHATRCAAHAHLTGQKCACELTLGLAVRLSMLGSVPGSAAACHPAALCLSCGALCSADSSAAGGRRADACRGQQGGQPGQEWWASASPGRLPPWRCCRSARMGQGHAHCARQSHSAARAPKLVEPVRQILPSSAVCAVRRAAAAALACSTPGGLPADPGQWPPVPAVSLHAVELCRLRLHVRLGPCVAPLWCCLHGAASLHPARHTWTRST